MQPTYMPWAGYFNLIARVDVFVFLDDVQFEKQSWQNRNKVLVNGQPHWLTVPVRRRHLDDRINTIETDETRGWRRKHMELLKLNYSKHPYARQMFDLVEEILEPHDGRLCGMNKRIIRRVSALLGLSPAFVSSGDLGIEGHRSERLMDICSHFGCDSYLSPGGASEYLAEDGIFGTSEVALEFQTFEAAPYPQRGSAEFVSHLSILDLIANLGNEATRRYVLQ